MLSCIEPKTLATQSSEPVFWQVAPWLLLLVGIVVLGAILLPILRNRIYRSEDTSSDGFTLHDLRTLHASGELSDEEFERAKAAIIGSVSAGNDQTSENGEIDDLAESEQ